MNYCEPSTISVSAKEIAELLGFIGRSAEYLDFIKEIRVPGVYSFSIDTFSQYVSDTDEDYSFAHKSFRAIIIATEGLATGYAAGSLAAIYAVPGMATGPGDIVIISAVFLSTSYVVGKGFEQANTLYFFPGLRRAFNE